MSETLCAATHGACLGRPWRMALANAPEDCAKTIALGARCRTRGRLHRRLPPEPRTGGSTTSAMPRNASPPPSKRPAPCPFPFTLTARAENHFTGDGDLADSIRRSAGVSGGWGRCALCPWAAQQGRYCQRPRLRRSPDQCTCWGRKKAWYPSRNWPKWGSGGSVSAARSPMSRWMP